jgi:hypothetical protein
MISEAAIIAVGTVGSPLTTFIIASIPLRLI